MFYLGLIENGLAGYDLAKRILANVFGLHVLPFLGFEISVTSRETSMGAFRRRSFLSIVAF
jgi:hypothetical protein